VVLLNFPLTTLAERDAHGPSYTRRQWAEARLAGRFARRVPARCARRARRPAPRPTSYMSQYNVWTHHVVDGTGERLFPAGLRLISHWNLRDELKASATPIRRGSSSSGLIVKVMERIVTQTIPQAVIDNPRVDWEPDDATW
jgi:hypothetical protein